MTANRKSASPARASANVRVTATAASLAAMSVVLGKFLAINVGSSFRFSLENLPVLIAGILLGPYVGAAVGVCADALGCLMVGYAVNPVITLGAGCVGFFAGLAARLLRGKPLLPRTAAAVFSGHAVGSVLVKSAGMFIYFHTPLQALALRVPLYIGVGAAEFYIISLLLRNKAFAAELERTQAKR